MARQRARIGIIYPEDGYIDEDFWAFAPQGVTLLFTRIANVNDPDDMRREISQAESKDIERCTEMLATGKANAIASACTAASFVKPGLDHKIAERIKKASGGIPGVTTSASVVEALKRLGSKNISILSPYSEEINDCLKGYVKSNGFDIVSFKELLLGKTYGFPAGDASPEQMIGWGTEAFRAEADALFIPCTGFKTSDVIEPLEKKLGKPVVTSNQATVWRALELAGIDDPVYGRGRLLELPIRIPERRRPLVR